MAAAKDIIRYLRECYRENGSRGGLWNVFADSVSHRVFLKDSDFLATRPEADDSHYLREAASETAAKQADLYQKEKDLIYTSLFVLGWAERTGDRPEPICAPLFWYPATLHPEGLKQGTALRIDPDRRQL
ncbi:MAG: hypothetical protein KDL87_19795, partial [Verrucomicrobiae bacterium]|nr:hypothetical protein [Verrucomicrobiae bacterium]